MSRYTARVEWQRSAGDEFTARRYSRRHLLSFDGGATWTASSSPAVVALPWSDPAAVDPEEMFVAALASCHMLWFLDLAARHGLTVERYADDAAGVMARDERGRWAMTEVTLRPQVVFGGDRQPGREEHAALHHEAHAQCYIANSVLTRVRCEPRP